MACMSLSVLSVITGVQDTRMTRLRDCFDLRVTGLLVGGEGLCVGSWGRERVVWG